MAVAGKVAITLSTENGGAWSADVTYDRLVAVKHNNNLYISRKTVANVEPPNDEFWFLALEGFSGDDIEDIINGTTQVGNAKTLDGHGAGYFATLERITNPKGWSVKNPIIHLGEISNLDTLDGLLTVSCVYSCISASSFYLGFHNDYLNGYGAQIKLSYWGSGMMPVRRQIDGVWGEWKDGAKAEDLAKYLPLTGGTVNGALTVSVANFNDLPLVQRNATGDSMIRFINSNGALGRIGFNGASKEVGAYLGDDGSNDKFKAFFHTGNKPSGSYTGNGSATARNVKVGGVGNCIMVRRVSSEDFAIVTESGYIGRKGGVVVNGSDAYWTRDGGGNLYMATTSELFNASGGSYYYESL